MGSATAAVVRHTTGDGSGKAAARLAAAIAGEVIADGWRAGACLGSADALTSRYEVSRATFREAVRILERQHVVYTKRGQSGGLFVTAPTTDALTEAVVAHLRRIDAPLDETFEPRLAVEALSARLACERIDRTGRSRLQTYLDQERRHAMPVDDLRGLLASLGGNPVLQLLVPVLAAASRGVVRAADVANPEQERAADLLAVAVITRDATEAVRLTRSLVDGERRVLRRRPEPGRAARDLDRNGDEKLAERVAHAIDQEITDGRLAPGHHLGSEPELIERHGASRAVFCEAVRLLEHEHVASMRRGAGGGLFVSPPDAEAVAELVALHLARLGTSPASVAQVRHELESATSPQPTGGAVAGLLVGVLTAVELASGGAG